MPWALVLDRFQLRISIVSSRNPKSDLNLHYSGFEILSIMSAHGHTTDKGRLTMYRLNSCIWRQAILSGCKVGVDDHVPSINYIVPEIFSGPWFMLLSTNFHSVVLGWEVIVTMLLRSGESSPAYRGTSLCSFSWPFADPRVAHQKTVLYRGAPPPPSWLNSPLLVSGQEGTEQKSGRQRPWST